MTFPDPATALQYAVHDRLSLDPELSARVSGVYDEAPLSAAMPYISMGQTQLYDTSVKARRGYSVQFDLMVWSKDTSQLEVKELMALMDSRIASPLLTVRGFSVAQVKLESAVSIRRFREDGSLYEGKLRYKVQLYEGES